MSDLSLYNLPPELRILLYHCCLADQWQGKMPALIVALRGDSRLYHEALEVFYATNTLHISAATEQSLYLLSSKALRTVKRARFMYHMRLQSLHEWDLGIVPRDMSYPLWHMHNLESLTLTPNHLWAGYWIHHLYWLVRYCITHFSRLRHLAIKIPSSSTTYAISPESDMPNLKEAFVRNVSIATDVPYARPNNVCDPLEYWEWDAGINVALFWSDHQYTWSVPWKNVGVVYQHLTNRHRQVFWRNYGTTYVGLMCRHIFPLCDKTCSCASIPPPPFLCTQPGHICGVAPRGLDSFDSYSIKLATKAEV